MSLVEASACTFTGVTLNGLVNVDDAGIAEHVTKAIRRQHQQLWPQPVNRENVCLVGGGPSLAETEGELVELVHQGAKLVTVNGSYAWCLARNLKPSAQVVVDARPGNGKFLVPEVPNCWYWLASQCAPDTWDAVEGRPQVGIWHAASADNVALKPILDAYYLTNWVGVTGGSTVVLRTIGLLRMLGYVRMHLFGVDSCYLDGAAHAYAQPENDHDDRLRIKVGPTARPDLEREFLVSSWHLSQADDFIKFVKASGDSFLLHVHGRGLLAWLLESGAEIPPPVDADARPAKQPA